MIDASLATEAMKEMQLKELKEKQRETISTFLQCCDTFFSFPSLSRTYFDVVQLRPCSLFHFFFDTASLRARPQRQQLASIPLLYYGLHVLYYCTLCVSPASSSRVATRLLIFITSTSRDANYQLLPTFHISNSCMAAGRFTR